MLGVVAKTREQARTDRSRDETVAMLGVEGLRAALVVWLVVNAVNLLQSVGFATRPFAPEVNPVLGLVIAALAIPATWALLVFRRRRAGWLFLAGPLAFDAFVLLFFRRWSGRSRLLLHRSLLVTPLFAMVSCTKKLSLIHI